MNSHGNIFLTGFMGSGKSSMGKKLSQLMRRDFVDLDKYIEKKAGTTISLIFSKQGEEAFRTLEQTCLHEVIRDNQKSIIALGGGTVCFYDNLQIIQSNGLLIYLQLSPKSLADRIKKSRTKRPLLQHLKSEELLESIEQKMEQRKKFYEQAHIHVNALNLTAQILQHNIIEFQKEHST